jgi:predicted CoA-substrate-specific enzyme activase
MFAGVDIGSVTTKAVIIDENSKIVSFEYGPTLTNREKSGEEYYERALGGCGLKPGEILNVVSTGYGRRAFTRASFNSPEIICHAKGTVALFPGTRVIIDIGGQDSKVIELGQDGRPQKFAMNDKCAAGTGRFLEVMAGVLGLTLESLGPVSLESKESIVISSVCTVFAESEIVSLLSENKKREDIAWGLHRSIVRRVANMGTGSQIKYLEPIVFSGGVARNVGVVKALEEMLKMKVICPEKPQVTAALGAALIARERSSGPARV